jgi:hypothetical protein
MKIRPTVSIEDHDFAVDPFDLIFLDGEDIRGAHSGPPGKAPSADPAPAPIAEE